MIDQNRDLFTAGSTAVAEPDTTTPATSRQLVPRQLVRRINDCDVFITGLRRLRQDMFEVGVRLPASHRFYGPVGANLHDPLLLLESLRQATFAVSFAGYEIPTDDKFVLHDYRIGVHMPGLRTAADRPVDLQFTVTAHDIRRRGNRIAGMRLEYTCFRVGQLIATGSIGWSLVSPSAYRKLRGDYTGAVPAAPRVPVLSPGEVGRQDEIDVMLAENPGGRGWLLRVRPDHPEVFDHASDHVPGNGLVEAARQAALRAVGRADLVPVSVAMHFQHYVEFDKPCDIVTEVDTGAREDTVRVHFLQGEHTAATATVSLREHG